MSDALHLLIPSPAGRPPRQHLEAEVLLGWVRSQGFTARACDPALAGPTLEEALTTARREATVVYWHLPSAAELEPLEAALAGLPAGSDSDPLHIAGGYFAQTFDRELLDRVPGLDGVVRGEPEGPILDLLRAAQAPAGRAWRRIGGLTVRQGDETRRNPLLGPGVALARMPRAAADLFHPDRRRGGQQILLGRGCNSDCSYCGLQTVYRQSFPGRREFWRARPAAAVVDEIEHYHRQHGVVSFHLSAFVTLGYDAAGTDLLAALADELVRRDLGIEFRFVTHPGHLVRNAALLPRLRAAGLAGVSLGLDSGSQAVLERFRVPFRLPDSHSALRLLHRQQVPFVPQFIFYEPRMSLDEIGENLAFLRRAAPWFAHLPQPYSVYLYRDLLTRSLQVRWQTPVHEELDREGLWQPPESITGGGKTYFRDPAVGRFFQGHRRLVQPILRELKGDLFDPQRCAEDPSLALLPLDLLDRWLAFVRAGELSDDEAARRLSSWATGRLTDPRVQRAPVRVAQAP